MLFACKIGYEPTVRRDSWRQCEAAVADFQDGSLEPSVARLGRDSVFNLKGESRERYRV